MRIEELASVSQQVAEVSGRTAKVERLAGLLSRLPFPEIELGVAFLTGTTRQGRVGIGPAALSAARSTPAASTSSLELREIDEVFERIARQSGAGSAAEKARLLRELLGRATGPEQDFLVRLLFGEL